MVPVGRGFVLPVLGHLFSGIEGLETGGLLRRLVRYPGTQGRPPSTGGEGGRVASRSPLRCFFRVREETQGVLRMNDTVNGTWAPSPEETARLWKRATKVWEQLGSQLIAGVTLLAGHFVYATLYDLILAVDHSCETWEASVALKIWLSRPAADGDPPPLAPKST